MSFSVHLSQDLLTAEAGSNTPITVTVKNRGAERDRYEIEIAGIDSEWTAVPVPSFSVEPGEERSERVFFRPPRTSESGAGTYPIVFTVRSLETGESQSAQAVLELRPFHHITMEVSPKKGFVSPMRRQNSFELSVVNLGNTPHTLQLFGSDPEDVCAYEFEEEQVSIGPGQQRDVEMIANPSRTRFFSSGRLVGFSVTARSTDVPQVAATAQAQLEVRSLLSPASLALLVFLAVLFGLWYVMMPKPPSVQLGVDPMRVTQGDTVNVSWTARDATRVVVTAGDATLYDGPDLKRTISVRIDSPSMGIIRAVARKEGRASPPDERRLTVNPPPVVTPPAVLGLDVNRSRVRLGGSFVLSYRFNDAVTRARLAPLDKELDPNLGQIEIVPTDAGAKEYYILAYNAAGRSVRSRTVRVSVYEESDATILAFEARPRTVQEANPQVTLSWQAANAVRVELQEGSEPAEVVEAANPGRTLEISAKTSFVLTAYDAKGRKVSRRLTVGFEKAPPPPPPTTGETTGATAGGPGETTGGPPPASTTAGAGQ